MEVFNHGSGETSATSIAEAYEAKKPWFGYYWGPTAVLGKYDMVKVDVGPYIEEVHACAQKKIVQNLLSLILLMLLRTGITNAFAKSNPEIAELMSKVSFTNDQLNGILAWQEKESASAEEAAVQFITTNGSIWSEWINDPAKKKRAAL